MVLVREDVCPNDDVVAEVESVVAAKVFDLIVLDSFAVAVVAAVEAGAVVVANVADAVGPFVQPSCIDADRVCGGCDGDGAYASSTMFGYSIATKCQYNYLVTHASFVRDSLYYALQQRPS